MDGYLSEPHDGLQCDDAGCVECDLPDNCPYCGLSENDEDCMCNEDPNGPT